MSKVMRNTRGAISIFLVIVLVPMMIFSSIYVDMSRINLARSVATSAGDLTLNSALTNYQSIADQTMMLVISEWQAPDAKNIGDLLFYFLPIALITLGMLMSHKRFRVVDVMVMLVFLFLFFRSVRFIVLWYIAAVFYAFPYLPTQKIKNITGKAEKIAVILLVVALLGVGVHGGIKAVSMCRNGDCISEVTQEDVIDIVKQDSPKRLFNDYNLGEALIYHDIPVFIDARADMYAQDDVLSQTVALLNMTLDDTSVEDVLREYGVDAVLLLRCRALYSYIISHPEYYEYVYENDTVAYYRIKQAV